MIEGIILIVSLVVLIMGVVIVCWGSANDEIAIGFGALLIMLSTFGGFIVCGLCVSVKQVHEQLPITEMATTPRELIVYHGDITIRSTDHWLITHTNKLEILKTTEYNSYDCKIDSSYTIQVAQ